MKKIKEMSSLKSKLKGAILRRERALNNANGVDPVSDFALPEINGFIRLCCEEIIAADVKEEKFWIKELKLNAQAILDGRLDRAEIKLCFKDDGSSPAVAVEVSGDEMRVKVTFSSEVDEMSKGSMRNLIDGILSFDPDAKKCVDWPGVSEDPGNKEVANRYHYILPLGIKTIFTGFVHSLGLQCVYVRA